MSCATAGAVVLGIVTATRNLAGLAVAGLVALAALAVADPVLLAVAAFPATLLVQRAGGGGAGASLSLSDVVLIIAFVAVLPKVRWGVARYLRAALVPAFGYELITVPTILAHPNVHDSLEWGHRLEMMGGALIVGWVVGVSGRAKQAATALLVGCVILAALAMEHSAVLHFQPAQWGEYQKNYIGSMMWAGAIMAHLNPPWLGVPRRLATFAKYMCILGLLAAQSKQGIIALVAMVLLAAVMQPSVRRRSKWLLATLVPVLVAGYVMLASGIARSAQFNTVAIRTTAFSAEMRVWLLDPVFGQGMRWFYLPHFAGYIQPPDILLETLTDAGLLGVLATVVLLAGSVRVLRRLPRAVGTLAIVLVVGRVVQAIFDVYWVSAATTLPWLVAGMAVGVGDAMLLARRRGHQSAGGPAGPATTAWASS